MPVTGSAKAPPASVLLDAESTRLANKHDPHLVKAFAPSIKGETDRFACRFVSPDLGRPLHQP